MRKEFKFRAWNTKESKWMFGYEYPELGGFNLLGEVVLTGQLSSISLKDLDDVEIMQFTGIRDKNGKEIYEGDIIQIDDLESVSMWIRGEKAIVQYSPGRFQSKTFSGDVNMMQQDTGDVSMVIGNIHENPELLP